ncbi:hypothetical protein C5F47_07140 [Nitrosopumilus cobalaminigenes]|uniref:Uncharacterized protein n=2 Tax=Nitrosopumilus cobalaminigenes TaxID=1470066 RepID=A0A7D5QXY2_9ARCH|nr:hypothetical protein C5F47_07140 [Nitrosopumilus cobalaminigenes]
MFAAIALASILLISGFNLPAVDAQLNPTVKKVKIANVAGQAPIFQSESRTIAYTYVFEACAGDKPIRSPEVVVSSDSEVRSVKLAIDLSPNACQVSATQIKAASPDTIKGKLFTKDTVTKMANTAEKRLGDIKVLLSERNTALQKLVKSPDSPENTSKLVKLSSEIVELRKELKDARAEYYRLLFIIHG